MVTSTGSEIQKNTSMVKKNPEKKEDTCISFIEKSRSEFCTVIKKQISLTNNVVAKKTSEIVEKFPRLNTSKETSLIEKKETSLIEKIAKKSIIYNRR